MGNRKQIISRTAVVYIGLLFFVIYIYSSLIKTMFFEGNKWKIKINSYAVNLREDKPNRGNIYDDKGKLLATSVNFFDVHMDTRAGGLTDKLFNEKVDSLAICLSNFFKDKTKEDYKKKLINARRRSSRFLKIADKLTYDEFVEIKKFPLFRYNSNKGGFLSKKTTKRKRPFDRLMRRTIGFLSEHKGTGLKQGKAGLEYTYNRELGGRSGKSYMKKIGGGNWMKIKGGEVLEKENGMDLHTSIDIDLQDYVDDILRKQLTKLKADYGSVVVMEVKTGYIKAIANLKRYENNTFTEVLNYAIGENLAPGSTFKLPVLMAALEDGVVGLNDIIDTKKGNIHYKGVDINDSDGHAYGKITVEQVFAKSSNVGMVKIIDENYVKKGKIKHFLKQLYALGIGDISGVDISGEDDPIIKSPDNSSWAPSTPGMIAHGYEVRISPLQLLNFYNAVANNGQMVKPQIVKKIEKNGIILKEFKPQITNSLICSKSTLKKAQKILRDVVTDGTAKLINTKKYKISGKTGTTEYYDAETKTHNDKYRASFVGYFPSENPKYSIIVVINKPKTDFYGALAAAPVFKKIADKIFKGDRELNPNTDTISNTELPLSKNGNQDELCHILTALSIPIKKNTKKSKWVTSEVKENKILFNNKKIKAEILPDLRYMGAKDAIYIIENMGAIPLIKGRGFVTAQSIAPGTKIKKGMKIKIELK